MRLIDRQFMATPAYGSRTMRDCLRRQGLPINLKRVRRLMRLMGISAVYPKPRASVPQLGHKIYPYLLRDLTVSRQNQVWASDITCIPMRHGFMYLVALMD